MSQVEIYVRSSSLGQQVGIHWRNISKPEQPKEEPVALEKQVIARDDGQMVTVNAIINDTKPSLILARYENKVLLEVTGLDATEDRSKNMGRKISEVVLWVGDASEDIEEQLRKLAACALLSFWEKESTFITTIRSAIDFDGNDSFRANAQQIKQLYDDAAENLDRLLSKVSFSEIDSSEPVWLTQKKKIDIESQLYSLVKKISQTALPEGDEPVVVVAEFKKEGDKQWIVYKGNVWEKKTQSEPQPTLQPEPQPTLQPEPQPTLQPESQPPLQPDFLLKIYLGALVVLRVVILTILIIILTPTPVL